MLCSGRWGKTQVVECGQNLGGRDGIDQATLGDDGSDEFGWRDVECRAISFSAEFIGWSGA